MKRVLSIAPWLLAAASLVLTIVLGASRGSDRKVIYETWSRFNHIIVQEDERGLRYLLFSETGGYQSVLRPGETEKLELPYSHMMLAGLACVEEPERILLVGLGGGSIPTFLHPRYPKTRIDCVEIDPEVIDVAKRFFGFQEDGNLRAYARDGREFIEGSTDRYDVIFLDAFGNDFVPPSLTTKEFLTAVRKILTPRGVVLGNVWSRLLNPVYDSMIRTYLEVFDQVCLFNVPERENIIVLAIPRKEKIAKEDLSRKAAEITRKRRLPFDLAELVQSGYRDARTMEFTAPVLEDAKIRAEAKAGH